MQTAPASEKRSTLSRIRAGGHHSLRPNLWAAPETGRFLLMSLKQGSSKIEWRVRLDWPGEKVCIRVIDLLERFGIGILRPAQIRRTARARAEVRREEALLDAQTRVDSKALSAGDAAAFGRLSAPRDALPPSPRGLSVRQEPQIGITHLTTPTEVIQMATLRARVDAVEKLLNLRAVHRLVEKEAERYGDRSPPPFGPSADWVSAWKEGAERVEEGDLRLLWARVFCEEVMDPRSYSKRTLEILKVLGHDEALVLSKIAPRVTHGSLLHTGDNNDELVDGIPFKECLMMEEAGILVATGGSILVGYGTAALGNGRHLLFMRHCHGNRVWQRDRTRATVTV